ncbi:PQQ-binding-like beta-propeller repeat protein [Lacimicrobium sp. SS2-24]|uniref:outer membrane protein assembly factor BamB family protein n=1 Tax=Lacimicrobium sp. SS2-24 TaxID=2005569 RepID=UPI000B4A5CF1|nr:PQQ-binding-like beta-propeller repeat protein [Lacimicrobium sp. SS2-24]
MNDLFLGIHSHVVCINKSDGNEVWRVKLKRANLTNVCYEDNHVYAYAGGHLFCLSAKDGTILWENPLKGLGYSTCIIANAHQSSSVVSSQVAAQQAVAVSGATTASAGDAWD